MDAVLGDVVRSFDNLGGSLPNLGTMIDTDAVDRDLLLLGHTDSFVLN